MPLELLLIAVSGWTGPPGSDWRDLTRPLLCRPQIEARLQAFGAASEVSRAPSGVDGASRYRIATSELGVWITLELAPGDRVRLYRTEATSGTEVAFDDACRETERELAGLPETAGRRFTDADLASLLADNPRLVVYLWTPNLPLSVEGYREIVEATSSVHAALVALVDPSADPEYVREVADAEGIPLDARRRMASVELLFRDLAVHAPAIVVFTDGKALPVLPGYRSARAYAEYLRSAGATTKKRRDP